METPGRPAHPRLTQRLLERPTRFEFFQAVRALLADAGEKAVAPGGVDSPERESILFRTGTNLRFPATQLVAAVDSSDPERIRIELTVAFFGLLGAAGVLPHHYTVTAIERAREGDRAMTAFLDVFNNRLVALFYRAWAKHRIAVQFERNLDDSPRDLFTMTLLSLMGLREERTWGRGPVGEFSLARFAGLYGSERRSVVGLEAVLRDYFKLPVNVIQFVGQWLDIPPEARTRLPSRHRPGLNCQLGGDAVLGGKLWDVQGRFTVRVGPVGFDRYVRFIRGGDELAHAGQLTRLWARGEFDFDVRPVLRAADVPSWKLESKPHTKQLLGRTVWLRSINKPFEKDFDGAAYEPDENTYTRSASPAKETAWQA